MSLMVPYYQHLPYIITPYLVQSSVNWWEWVNVHFFSKIWAKLVQI